MAKAKKKLLPKDFQQTLEEGNLEKLQAVFQSCDVNARGGLAKQAALAFDECPDELARWLVGEGADLSITDSWGNTPLHTRARSRRGRPQILLELGADVHSATASVGTPLHVAAHSHRPENARVLIQYGASAGAVSKGMTPLEVGLSSCSNIDLENMAVLAEVLLEAGAQVTPRAQDYLREAGKRFEFIREKFNPDSVDAASHALHQLYALLNVPPMPRRIAHDGRSVIVVPPGTWPQQHEALWQLLVPGSGHAATMQGEVIRISGRIANELDGNGGINWDGDFRKMADAFLDHMQQGQALPDIELTEVAALVKDIKGRCGDTHRLCQLAVAWVMRNTQPIPLPSPPYRR